VGSPATDIDPVAAAREHGKICALAADSQRDLQKCESTYAGLFPKAFDARLYSAISLANAFGSPWSTAGQLRIANLTSLWIFAADWLVDYVATTQDEIDRLVLGCMTVADGGPATPDIPLTGFLLDIRDELAGVSGPLPIWREQLRRYFEAVSLEWNWKKSGALPSFEVYLDNADNFGSTWVNLSHWTHTGVPVDRIAELWPVSQEVQRILRLLNDLATHQRDQEWGDLNALMLGVTPAEVGARITALVSHCRALVAPLRETCPEQALYLERQIGYSTGFYGTTDYWGEL
jgi:hypothetical protein